MHSLPSLRYAYTDLEPHLDGKTLEIHHGKHHQTYVNKLNEILTGTEYAELSLVELILEIPNLPENLKTPVTNNAGQVYNHNLYWESMSPNGGVLESGSLSEKIDQKWGALDKFLEEFAMLGATQFGSGWVWLSVDKAGELVIEKTSNAESPLMHGRTPIMTMDVWEHAYYLKYQNLRPDYIQSFFKLIDWQEVGRKYEATVV